MEVKYIDFKNIPEGLMPSAACIGYFDGLHKGHKALVEQAETIARIKEIPCAVITFDPDPWVVFFPEKEFRHITSIPDKIQILEQMGVDQLYIIHFDKEFASQTPEQFHEILARMQIQSLICGFDFHYGYKNTGDIDTLQRQPYFDVTVVDAITDKNGKISSTRIEKCIEDGLVLEAARLLDYCYSIAGEIVHGYHRGTALLKFPTANLKADSQYLLPKIGVYSGMVNIDQTLYPAMINLGANPTFQNAALSIEAHIINFDQDIYEKEVRFFFIEKIRDEMRFPSPDALAGQLKRDVETAKKQYQIHQRLVQNTAELWEKITFIG